MLLKHYLGQAFCQIAIYGKTFCQAATDTWDLFQRSGIAAIANDNIIGTVLVMGSFFGGLFVGAVGAIITLIFPDLNLDVYAMFLIGFVVRLECTFSQASDRIRNPLPYHASGWLDSGLHFCLFRWEPWSVALPQPLSLQSLHGSWPKHSACKLIGSVERWIIERINSFII